MVFLVASVFLCLSLSLFLSFSLSPLASVTNLEMWDGVHVTNTAEMEPIFPVLVIISIFRISHYFIGQRMGPMEIAENILIALATD